MKYHLDTLPGKNLLLGGGKTGRGGWINLDLYAKNADIKQDLNKVPYPFKDHSIDQIEATCIFEHLVDWKNPLLECARILKPGGLLLIQVPHYGSAYMWTHYDHKRAFSAFSFDMFAKNSGNYFVDGDPNDVMLSGYRVFKSIKRYILFPKGWWIWGRAFEIIFNLSNFTQLFYELWLSGIFKASGIMVILEK